jgi:two-component system OmpR family sensor kinase/two-component system sensor histidine kinase QseC
MSSLRKHMLVWLLPVFLVAAVVASVWTYYMFGNMVSMFMDNQMSVIADSHAVETLGPPTLRPMSDHHVEKGGLVVQIWDGQGGLLTSSYPALPVPLQASDGFSDVRVGSQRWRVYTMHGAGRTVQSIQNLEFRAMVINKQAFQTGLPIALLMPISAWILWFGACRAMGRLEALEPWRRRTRTPLRSCR